MKTQKIIIKKKKKRGHEGGHHGGSWKVAYADFVTAMMAFFLLLWLLSMVAPEKRARVSAYFKHFSLFDKAGSSMFMDAQGGIMGESSGELGKVEQEFGKGVTDEMSPEKLRNELKREVELKLSDLQDQVLVDISKEGVRIQLIDKEGKPLFPVGSSDLSPNAVKILSVLADNITSSGNRIAIEGHTDALSYSSSRYTNWELSTERASAARRELERNGVNPDMLTRVAGFAATVPLIEDNPNDPRNRRVSIILLSAHRKAEGNAVGEPPQKDAASF